VIFYQRYLVSMPENDWSLIGNTNNTCGDGRDISGNVV